MIPLHSRVIPSPWLGPSDEDLVLESRMVHLAGYPATVVEVRGRAVRIQSDYGRQDTLWWWPVSHVEIQHRTHEEVAMSEAFRREVEAWG